MVRLIPLLCVALFSGCVTDESAQTNSSSARHAADGTPRGVGLLDFLNDSAATLAVLDHQVPLDARAARNLVSHRDGADGKFGTADDDLFDSVAEVDAIKYVGTSALSRLYDYAETQGYVPQGGDLLGTWDNVSFTVDEAEAVLDLVNTASETELDDTVGLDRRAVTSILAARDVPSILVLSELYFVGASALRKLLEHVGVVPNGLAMGEDCLEKSECADGLTCYGKVADGSTEFGKCVDMNQAADQGMDCTTDADCTDGSVCMGDEVWNGMFCVNAWQEGTFSMNESLEIPDMGSVESSVVVYGLATVPIDVVLTLDIDHPDPSSLQFTMYNFNGYESNPAQLDAELVSGGRILVRAFPSDDMVNGTYTLVMTDTKSGGIGVINGWDLRITSTFD